MSAVNGPVVDLSGVEQWARRELEQRNAAREEALKWSREMIRACATCIRAVHRREIDRAEALLAEAQVLHVRLTRALQPMGDLYWSGYVQDAQKELVEATTVLALVRGQPIPDPLALGVAVPPFLNGLGETVGELRRLILDGLRRGEVEQGEVLLRAMDEIYGLLVTIDYPDALTGGLRRTTDSVRGILEKTRGDLTLALRQEQLERTLREAADGAHR